MGTARTLGFGAARQPARWAAPSPTHPPSRCCAARWIKSH